jgi:uncharacterized membrane protein YsdA (DUF1294 family)
LDIQRLVYIIFIWNILVFAMFGIDKYKAARGKWRISEKALLICSFLMGGVGAMLGMSAFRHKTKHLKFKLLMPLALVVNAVLVYALHNKFL